MYILIALQGNNSKSLESVANWLNSGINTGVHDFPRRWVFAKNWIFGNKRIPSFSYRKCDFPIDRAWISLTLEADAKATKKTVFHVTYFISAEFIGSNGKSHKAHKTVGKSQFGSNGLILGEVLKIPLIYFDRSALLLTVLFCHPWWIDAIADLYPAIVPALHWRSSCKYTKKSATWLTEVLYGLIFLEVHQLL